MTAQRTTSLMELVLQGHNHQRAFSAPDVFAEAVQHLKTAVHDAGTPALLPADADAAALIGGAIIAGRGDIIQAHPDSDGRLPDKVLVVGATVVSGKHVHDKVVAARALGAAWVGTWLWRAPAQLDADALAADLALIDGYFESS